MTIPLKQWIHAEAARQGVSPRGIYNRFYKGKYPHLPLKRINQRVVLVELDKMNDRLGLGAYTEGR